MAELVEVQINPDLHEQNEAQRKARINRPKWVPGKWHPVYEEVVMLSIMGYSNTVIAEEKGFTKEHVSNIINTPQAKLIIELTLAQMEKKRVLSIDQRIERIATKAIGRVEEVINNDKFAEKNPGAMFDRAIVALKIAGKVKEPEVVEHQHRLMLPTALQERLLKGIEASDKARLLHSGNEIVIESSDANQNP